MRISFRADLTSAEIARQTRQGRLALLPTPLEERVLPIPPLTHARLAATRAQPLARSLAETSCRLTEALPPSAVRPTPAAWRAAARSRAGARCERRRHRRPTDCHTPAGRTGQSSAYAAAENRGNAVAHGEPPRGGR